MGLFSLVAYRHVPLALLHMHPLLEHPSCPHLALVVTAIELANNLGVYHQHRRLLAVLAAVYHTVHLVETRMNYPDRALSRLKLDVVLLIVDDLRLP